MKITKRQLARIIKEELQRVISEHPSREGEQLPQTSREWGEVDDELARSAEQESLWDGDYDVSPCCGVDQDSDIDICTNCGEHTGGGIPASEYYA